jgi:predicted phage terminase large subunit-like protein
MLNLSQESIKFLPLEKQAELDGLLGAIKYRWSLTARPSQLIPEGDWTTWLIKAGRGFGKTRTGAETARIWKDNCPIIHFVGATAGDARDIMVEGPAGILNVSPPWDKPKYEPSKRKVTWKNGAHALIFTADEPDRLRGPQCYAAWCDEIAAWKYPEDAWDNLMMGLRMGDRPRVIATTTPRPTKMIKGLIKDPNTHVTSGTTYENIDNLAPAFLNTIITKYEGTRLGRQELMAEMLEDIEGALWNQRMIDEARVDVVPDLIRVVVAIDPAVTSTQESDETGIVVGGKTADGHIYILDDVSGTYSPQTWASIALLAYHKHKADRMVAEVNNGGDLVETVIRNIDRNISYSGVHASRGKITRAEPVVALYEQKRVHHVGVIPKLEDQMVTWAGSFGEKSPDRVDALVWLVTFLMDDWGPGNDDCVA